MTGISVVPANQASWDDLQATEDTADDTVWSVTCFVVRTGYRRGGVS